MSTKNLFKRHFAPRAQLCPNRLMTVWLLMFFFSSRRRHTRFDCDWSSDVCSSDLFMGVASTMELLNQFNAISDKMAEPMDDEEMNKLLEKQGNLQEKIDHIGAWDIDSQLEMAMDALRCPPADTPVKVLSGGEKRRVALCRLLLQKPDVLIL